MAGLRTLVAVEAFEPVVLDVAGIDALIQALRATGRSVRGPVVAEGVIGRGDITSVADLPVGWSDEQEAGCYRLRRRDDGALFAYAVGPHAWQHDLFPARERLWRAQHTDSGVRFVPEPSPRVPLALFGVRPCELAALEVLDRVFGEPIQPGYVARRAAAFVVVAECGFPAATCFCSSTGTGPGAATGFDIALTELLDGGHRFVARPGSKEGARVLGGLPSTPATDVDLTAAEGTIADAATRQTRRLDTSGLPALLERTLESPRWDEVADRCLSCANCTLVCPTCFCHTTEDVTDLDGDVAERWRRWDSCFTTAFSYVHGGSIRVSTRSRYRQWLTHKLGTWWDQFGTTGCTGCGRCITWCPVGIDLTVEARALRDLDLAVSAATEVSS
ncbi:MAG TPA: 4Fe-4S dicluster domain-containing protein [Acidimicrobiales bacterium]